MHTQHIERLNKEENERKVESNKEIVTKVEKTYKKKKPDPIGGLGPTEDLPGYDG